MTLTQADVIAELAKRIRILEDKVQALEGPKSGFKNPTIAQVTTYCKERGNSIDPETFFNHYESNGWMVGKVKMKNWQAAIRTWEKNHGLQGQAGRGTGGRRPEPRSFYDRATEQSKLTAKGARSLLGVLGGGGELDYKPDEDTTDTGTKSAVIDKARVIPKMAASGTR